MGFLSRLFGGQKEEAGPDPMIQMLREFFDTELPEEYVNSPKYAVNIVKETWLLFTWYNARITLDMTADGSDFSGCTRKELEDYAENEGYCLLGDIGSPPGQANVDVIMDMYFDEKNCIAVRDGELYKD